MDAPRYPHICVELSGADGNAVSIMMRVRRALQRNNVPMAVVDRFMAEARSGDYDHVIETCCNWVDVS